MRLRGGDDIRRVLSDYSAMVYRLAFARTSDHGDAEDICQEVFMALVRKNPDFETEGERKAWLIRATVNRANSLWRAPWRRRVELRTGMEDSRAAGDDFPEVREALAALSGDDRALVYLYYFEGYRTDEIARMLGRRPDAVRQQLSRARKKLKRILDEGVSE